MSKGSIIFVHGTGVRLKSYKSTFDQVKAIAAHNGVDQPFIECAWGDPLGAEFDGLSLPDGADSDHELEIEEDFARWSWLFDDPLFELDKLTIRDTSQVLKPLPPRPGAKPAWLLLWEKIETYRASQELMLLLERGGLDDFWPQAWREIVEGSNIPKAAFEASFYELPDACRALARALIAEIQVLATAVGRPGPSRNLRDALLDRMIDDWGQKVYGLGTFLSGLFKRAATRIVRHHRAGMSAGAALPVGDILLYQAHAERIHQFIRSKIETAEHPVTLVCHSLGGIACVDLLALPNPPEVARLITVGSQAPLLYEMGALISSKPPNGLPVSFPPWLNIFDRDDFLSYVAGRLFPGVEDFESKSGQPFPDSHGAYFGDAGVWKKIARFIKA